MCRVVVAGVSAIAPFCLAASAGEHARPAGMLESFEPDCILAICQIYVYRHSVYGIRPGRRDDAGQNPESRSFGARRQDYYYKHVSIEQATLGIMCTALLGEAHMDTLGHTIQKTGSS
jgi:hypothetical protein